MKLSDGITQGFEQGFVVQLVPRHCGQSVMQLTAVVILRRHRHRLLLRVFRKRVPGGAKEAAHTDPAQCFLCGGIQLLQKARMHPIVTVHEGNPSAVTVGNGPGNPRIPGCGQSAVFLMNYMDPAVFFCVFLADLSAIVGTSIIYQNQIKRFIALAEDAAHTPMKKLIHLVNRHHHTDICHIHPLPDLSESTFSTEASSVFHSRMPQKVGCQWQPEDCCAAPGVSSVSPLPESASPPEFASCRKTNVW